MGGEGEKVGTLGEWKSWEKGDEVWLESKCCEAVKKRSLYSSYLFLV